MIDIHSHILWGMDDGADTLEESVAMLKMAAESGTTDIVATPHANSHYRFQPELIRQRIEEICREATIKPRIHTGCDFHLSFENVQDALEHPARYLINSGPYLLVEFPNSPLAGMGRILTTLLDRGFVPIMTHPERNAQLRRIGPEFIEWIEKGCLVQVTAQSLLGRFGKSAEEASWAMVRRGLAHFIASDAHDTADRPPRLDAAFEAVRARAGLSTARALAIENPRAALSGDPISIEAPKKKPWYSWGRWR
jgi:protein-tyrosine phosphatase